MTNKVPPFKQDLTGDFEVDLTERHDRNYRVGSGRSRQATHDLQRILKAHPQEFHLTDKHGNHKYRNDLRYKKGPLAHALLRITKKKYTEDQLNGKYTGLTPRQAMARRLEELRTTYDGYMHPDTEVENKKFTSVKIAAQKAHHYVVARPLVSYKEKNSDHKHCVYGAYKDGSRWRCVQNLDHKKGGGEDTAGENNVRVRDKEDGTGPDRRTGLRDPDEDENSGEEDEAGGHLGSKRKHKIKKKKDREDDEYPGGFDAADQGYDKQDNDDDDEDELSEYDKLHRKPRTKTVIPTQKKKRRGGANENEDDTQPQDNSPKETETDRKKRVKIANVMKQLSSTLDGAKSKLKALKRT